MSENGYRYTGGGAQFRGVPARDITQAEYDTLGPREQRTVKESGVYKPMAAPKADPPKTEKKGGE